MRRASEIFAVNFSTVAFGQRRFRSCIQERGHGDWVRMKLKKTVKTTLETYNRPCPPPEESLRPLPLVLESDPLPFVVLILDRQEPAGGGGGGMICVFLLCSIPNEKTWDRVLVWPIRGLIVAS